MAEPLTPLRADIAYLLASRGLDGPPRDDWTGWERGYRAALDEVQAAARAAAPVSPEPVAGLRPSDWAARRLAVAERWRAVAEELGKPASPFEVDGAVGADARTDLGVASDCHSAAYDRRALLNVVATLLDAVVPEGEDAMTLRHWYDRQPRSYAKVDGAEYGYDVARREIQLWVLGLEDGA